MTLATATGFELPISMALLPPGMYREIPAALYHARVPGLVSKSVLDLVERSPKHYEAWLRGAAGETSPALEFGAATHCGVLEPDEYDRLYAVQPDFGDLRFKENKAKREEWKANNGTKTPLSAADAEAIAGMRQAIMAHPTARGLLVDGDAELTLRWTDPHTRLMGKARTDFFVGDLATIVDLKTTEDARPDAFAKSCARFRYHVQAAVYTDAFLELGVAIEHFIYLAIEKKPPYAIGIYELDDDAIHRGREAARRNMDTLAECIERGEYPCYSPEIQTLSLPRWAA